MRKRDFIATLTLVCAALAGCTPTTSVVQAPPPVLILPGAQLEQFEAAVGAFRRQIELTSSVPAAKYAGVDLALFRLADAIQLMPRAADVLPTTQPANRIRDDAGRIGTAVLDDRNRTAYTKDAIAVATETLARVASEAYPNNPELGTYVVDMENASASIDPTRMLDEERLQVVRALTPALAILESMRRTAAGPPQAARP